MRIGMPGDFLLIHTQGFCPHNHYFPPQTTPLFLFFSSQSFHHSCCSHYSSYSKYDENKYVWELPFDLFDHGNNVYNDTANTNMTGSSDNTAGNSEA